VPYKDPEKKAASAHGPVRNFNVSQFYVTDGQSARVAREALLHRTAVSMTGTVGNGIRSFTGVVQAVEEDKTSSPKRWRITMRD
jgi:hypothetical protein